MVYVMGRLAIHWILTLKHTPSVDRDPFNFPIKPNQPSSRRKEQVEVGWANFHSPHFEVTAVRYNPNHSPPSRAGTATTASASTFKGSSSVDDVFYDHGEKMFADVKAVPITEVFPIDYHHVEQIILQPQMTDPDEASQEGNNDEKGLFGNNKNAATTTKTSRFFGGGFMMKAPPAETKEKVDKQVEKQTKKEVERLRKLEEQRLQEIQEAKEREDERIRRKEALLKREEERLAREQERILQEEERMMREEEERERRREERRLRELEIARLKEERRERELRKRDDLEFGRFEQTRQTKKSDEGGILAWEDVELQDDSFESFEVDWQGFPPPSTATSPRRPPQESRKREPRERAPRPPREPREPIKIECPTCTCPNKKLFAIIICLLLLAGIGVGIYFALDSFGALGGDDDRNPDCSAVMGGFAIPKESMYPTVRLSWVMDISGQSQWTSIPALTSAVRNHFQDTAIPTLAGCLGEQQDNVFGSQYDILNGYVRSVRDVGSCRAGEPQPCARVLVDFVVYVRGQSSVLDLIEHISTRYTNDVTDAMDQMENVRQTGLVGLFEQRS